MSKIQIVLATLLTVVLLALIVGPFVGAGVVSYWSLLPYGSWFGGFGWFGWIFPKFPYPW